MSGPWTTPPAGADLPPRNGNVQMYHTRQIYPRNDVTAGNWSPGRELVFQFESDPASGWLVPDQCKLYARFSIGTKGNIGRIGEAAAAHSRRGTLILDTGIVEHRVPSKQHLTPSAWRTAHVST